MAEHRFVTVDGVRTHYVAAGEGQPLLLLHGLGASLVAWAANIVPLSQRFSVFALDFPGHGDSDRPDVDYLPSTGSDFIRGFMETLSIPRASMMGNSMGGLLALRTTLDFPRLVERLVLVDSAGLGRELAWSVRALSLPLVGELLESISLRGTRGMLKRIFYDRSLIRDDLLHELYRVRRVPGSKQAILRALRGVVSWRGLRRRWIMLEHLRDLGVPVLVVWGAQDRVVPVRHARRAAGIAPGVELRVFDRCGHWPQVEKSAQFNRIALDFLSDQRVSPDGEP